MDDVDDNTYGDIFSPVATHENIYKDKWQINNFSIDRTRWQHMRAFADISPYMGYLHIRTRGEPPHKSKLYQCCEHIIYAWICQCL
jgi:hypothetical protein